MPGFSYGGKHGDYRCQSYAGTYQRCPPWLDDGSPRQNSQDVLRLIPVWDFYGYNIVENAHTEETEKEEYLGHSQLTVNALDGSIINRIMGY